MDSKDFLKDVFQYRTQEELAEKFGISPITVAKYERGEVKQPAKIFYDALRGCWEVMSDKQKVIIRRING